jgi:menaquinone-dependent protoporphyrinogen IX oxidase
MSENRTLIAFESKSGATEESAQKIAQILRSNFGLEVDLVDLGKQKIKDCQTYRNVVIGSGVRKAKIYEKALKCLENDYSGKRVAFFVCSGDAGEPAKYAAAKANFAEATIAQFPKIAPASVEAFGGRYKILGKTVTDTFDIRKVEAWALTLGNIFTQ